MFVDVELGARYCVPVHGTEFRVVNGGVFAKPADVNLHAATDVITGRAADAAALGVPVRSLAVFAWRSSDVCAVIDPFDPRKEVNRIATGLGSAVRVTKRSRVRFLRGLTIAPCPCTVTK